MSAPAVLRDVFHALRAELGEEDAGQTFEDAPPPLDRIDVMIYRPTAEAEAADVTILATIGMAAAAMPDADDAPLGSGGSGGRAELRLSRRGPLEPREQNLLAMQLANLAIYPWSSGRALGWGEIVTFPDDVPTFPGCRRVFLAGPWLSGQPGWIDTAEGPVRVIHVVPISETERARALASRPEDFFSALLDERDVTAPPTDHEH